MSVPVLVRNQCRAIYERGPKKGHRCEQEAEIGGVCTQHIMSAIEISTCLRENCGHKYVAHSRLDGKCLHVGCNCQMLVRG